MLIRDASPADFERILRLNEESVHFLSPLTPERLDVLHAEAAYHRVVDDDGDIAGFLLAFREGASYDSINYRWFANRFERFFYVDRIVVSKVYQGKGVGNRLYDDVFAFARSPHAITIACEFDIDPPNEASNRFHQRYGFKEIGRQFTGNGGKQVSLQSLVLEPA